MSLFRRRLSERVAALRGQESPPAFLSEEAWKQDGKPAVPSHDGADPETWIPTTDLPAIIGCAPRTARTKVKAWGLRVESDPSDSRIKMVLLSEVQQRIAIKGPPRVRQCKEPGCTRGAPNYSPYCEEHRPAVDLPARICRRGGCTNEPLPGKLICESCRALGEPGQPVRYCKTGGCGAVVSGQGKRYCGACRDRRRAEHNAARPKRKAAGPVQRTCRAMGCTSPVGRYEQYCAEHKRPSHVVRTCQAPGCTAEVGKRKLYCASCREKRVEEAREQYRASSRFTFDPIACPECHDVFVPSHGHQRYCSALCRERHNDAIKAKNRVMGSGLRVCPLCGGMLKVRRSIVVDNGAAIRRVFRCTGDGCHGRAVTVERVEEAA